MTVATEWDEFMDRVIAAQRQISRRGGSPHQYRVVVSPEYHTDLLRAAARTGAYTSHIDWDVRPGVPYGDIYLRHEVRAWPV